MNVKTLCNKLFVIFCVLDYWMEGVLRTVSMITRLYCP